MMGEEAEPCLETLVKLFGDTSCAVQAEAVRAVASCGEIGQMYAGAIARKMLDGHPAVRVAAIESMPLMGERGRSFTEEICALSGDPQVMDAVSWALEEMSKKA